ncbi:hypothetical protein HY630_03530 [Candidatus Uhrbacteria bacterium]|nr:hypothetical protein [Candidatus Uhrbacteria bacterium]
MKLVICAQDIRAISFGLVGEKGIQREETVETQPEGYLAALDQTLAQWNVVPSDLRGIIVVTGPGSFTASRVSTTIANGLAYTLVIPVVGIENKDHVSMRDLPLQDLPVGSGHTLSSYDRPPEITTSRKRNGDNARD